MLRYLIDSGRELTTRTTDDFTPLDFAVLNGHIGSVMVLVAAGALASNDSRVSRHALSMADLRGHTAVVEFFQHEEAAMVVIDPCLIVCCASIH